MADIAAAANLSRASLYKYFGSIDDLALEVQCRVFDLLAVALNHEAKAAEGSALERLEAVLEAALAFFDANQARIRFTASFDNRYRRAYPDETFARRYAGFLEGKLLAGGFDWTGDGSLRTDLDLGATLLAAGNSLVALMQRVATRGELISKEQHMDSRRQLEILVDMIISYVRPETGRHHGNPH